MTATALLVVSERDLAIAAAAVRSGVFPADQSVILVASLAEAAELEHPVLDLAQALVAMDGVPVVSLNALIHPRHPLGWRMADLTREDFLAALRAQGTPIAPTHLAHIGYRGPVHNTLRRLLDLRLVAVADTPELAAAAIAQPRRAVVLLDHAPGVRLLARRVGPRVTVVQRGELRRIGREMAAVGYPKLGIGFGATAVSWWRRYRRADRGALDPRPRATPAVTASEGADEAAANSLDFVIRTVSAIDAQRDASGTEAHPGR